MAIDLRHLVGKTLNKKFLLRDFRNAARFAPGVNPPRQKFEGYVNFILNRDLYASLYGDATQNEFRTQISSLIRTADLPSVVFQTETKNAYNKKKIVNTGVTYNQVSMTVFDTIGNEWLTTLMKYFSYHFMDPRNQQKPEDRDIYGGQPREGGVENINSSFGGNNWETGTSQFNSNIAGYNINSSAQFFERIDYILYHGNKGVQYSIINPVMAEFKPGNIDYASSDVQEFTMTFDYERFTVYNKLNFDLDSEDLDRFEELGAISGDLFEFESDPDGPGTPAKPLVLETGRTLEVLGTEQSRRDRSKQEIIGLPDGGDGGGGDGDEPVVPPATYGIKYDPKKFAQGREPLAGDHEFTDILGDVADSALNAVLRGQNVSDAIVTTAVHRASTAIGTAIANPPPANAVSNVNAISNTSTNQPPGE
jgi:hypothetical protein